METFMVENLSPKTICQITNGAISSHSLELREICLHFFLIYMRQSISVDNIEILDQEFSSDLLQRAFSPDYC